MNDSFVEWFSFIIEQFQFIVIAVSVLFVPGWTLLTILDRKRYASPLEVVVLSVALSMGGAIATAIGLDLAGIAIDTKSLTILYGLYTVAFVLVVRSLLQKKEKSNLRATQRTVSVSAMAIFAVVIGLKTLFFAGNTVPISTDLGHHTYWMEKIVQDGRLPVYEEREILMATSSEEIHSISDPKPISDVIIGEHVLFAILAILSETSLVSMYPMATLFIIHIVTILAVYTLSRRLFAKSQYRETIAVFAGVLSGVLFGLDSPQMKYIIGGVIGNTLGNILILSGILALVIGAVKRSSMFIAFFVALSFVLAYTHHLSMLLFVFSLMGMAILFMVVDFRRMRSEIFPIIFSVQTIAVFILGIVVFFFVWTPSYITNRAVETVVGQSQNEEHLGISIGEFLLTMGDARTLLGLLGLIAFGWLLWKAPLFLGGFRETRLAFVVMVGWTVPLLLLVFIPHVVGIDLPTIRTANYTILPLSIVASVFVVWSINALYRLPQRHRWVSVLGMGVFVSMFLFGGFVDNAQLLGSKSSSTSARELHRASAYLGAHYRDSERTVLYDHISLNGGSWMKLYFLRDYNYPFYRAHLFRYDRAHDKQERCTLWAFSTPDLPEARKCFDDLHIGALALNDVKMGKAFREHLEFVRIYDGREIAVYTRVEHKKE